MLKPRPTLLSSPGARSLLASSIIARLPLAMVSIALLVHVQHMSGSFALAGLVGGAYAACGAVAAPALGRVVDHRGQTTVLLVSSLVTGAALITAGLVPSDTPPAVLVGLAAIAGAAMPPVEACVRTLLPMIAAQPSDLPRLFAFESTALELTFVFGPPIALGVGVVWSTGGALVLCGVVIIAGTLLFARQRPSRAWRADAQVRRTRMGALREPAVCALVVLELGTGAVFGATEVGVTATAHAVASSAAAAPVLGLWGLGSLLGGIVATRIGGSPTSARGLVGLLTALAVGHGLLLLGATSLPLLGVIILFAGATIAPTVSVIYAMVGQAAPAGAETEAFSWLVTAGTAGAAVGAAVGGALAQSQGPAAVFAFAGLAGGVTVVAALVGSRWFGAERDPQPVPQADPA
jgi:MFS family permease